MVLSTVKHPVLGAIYYEVKSDSTIRFGIVNGLVWIRVDGRGSFQNAPNLKQFVVEKLKQSDDSDEPVEFILDLENCSVMDSTFMGTLTGTAAKVMAAKGKLEVINANERNFQLLENLGISAIVEIDASGTSRRAERQIVSSILQPTEEHGLDKLDKMKFVLEAHEELGNLNDENQLRFTDVIAYLKNDLEDKQN